MGGTMDPQHADQRTINLFHPIYHSFTYPIGSRIDLERILPADLAQEDEEELIDAFSEPPAWLERFSPLAVQVGDHVIKGRNAPDLMIKIHRLMFDMIGAIGRFIESSISPSAGENLHLPIMTLCIDPDTLHRLIETDFELGETAYPSLMKMIEQGVVAPCLTTPFHTILPMLGDAEVRLCARSAMIYYLRIMRVYGGFLETYGEDSLMVMPFWLPEGAYSRRVIRIVYEEFQGLCRREKLGVGHLLLMLDNHQAVSRENDVLMKSWNQIDPASLGVETNGRSSRSRRNKTQDLHPGYKNISVIFRDRAFSDWVISANPSVKKLLDRTIAKVDADINSQNVHYGWSHFEEIESMTYSPRSILNFQQKLVKLTELGYLPLSPDFYVRGKLRGEFGCSNHEPQAIEIVDDSVGNGWDLENCEDLSRWFGCTTVFKRLKPEGSSNGAEPKFQTRKIEKPGEDGPVQHTTHPCWKVAWALTRETVCKQVVGDYDTLKGGMLEVLADLTGLDSEEDRARNVHDFLAAYTFIYWREHFIQHDMAEADINIVELSNHYLRAGSGEEITEQEAAMAGAAAQAIYLSLESARSTGLGFENIDQRGFYQNVAMLTLSICNAMYVRHWQGDKRKAQKLLALLKEELFDFEGAWKRHEMGDLGISQKAWKDSIRSEISESKDNVVRRASLRIAARHLRPLGYTKEFTRADANLTTNVGHIWSHETGRESLVYENQAFCGVQEE